MDRWRSRYGHGSRAFRRVNIDPKVIKDYEDGCNPEVPGLNIQLNKEIVKLLKSHGQVALPVRSLHGRKKYFVILSVGGNDNPKSKPPIKRRRGI